MREAVFRQQMTENRKADQICFLTNRNVHSDNSVFMLRFKGNALVKPLEEAYLHCARSGRFTAKLPHANEPCNLLRASIGNPLRGLERRWVENPRLELTNPPSRVEKDSR